MSNAAKPTWMKWRANFLTGLAIVLPAVVSIAIFRWVFGTVSNVTDLLLFFVPRSLTHENDGTGPMLWYWSLAALVLAVLLVTVVGRAARNYIGRKVIEAIDNLFARVPVLNKIYGVIKEVKDAFSSSTKSSFKQVVLVEYPRKGLYAIGFLTSDDVPEPEVRLGRKLDGIFIPTTPNPTSGFLIMVPEEEVIHLSMSVPDGIKYVISLGSVVPGTYALEARTSGRLPEPAESVV